MSDKTEWTFCILIKEYFQTLSDEGLKEFIYFSCKRISTKLKVKILFYTKFSETIPSVYFVETFNELITEFKAMLNWGK